MEQWIEHLRNAFQKATVTMLMTLNIYRSLGERGIKLDPEYIGEIFDDITQDIKQEIFRTVEDYVEIYALKYKPLL